MEGRLLQYAAWSYVASAHLAEDWVCMSILLITGEKAPTGAGVWLLVTIQVIARTGLRVTLETSSR